MEFNFNVRGDTIKFLNKRVGYSGNANYRCNFLLSPEWDGLEAFAVFTKSGVSYSKLISDGNCEMAVEVLQEPGVFSVGIFGTNGQSELARVSTNLIYIEIEEGAFRKVEASAEATPEIWEQYVAACGEKVREAEAAKVAAEEAQRLAEEAKEGIEGFAVDAEASKNAAEAAAKTAEEQKAETIKIKEACEATAEQAETFKTGAEAAMGGAIIARDAANTHKVAAQAASGESLSYKEKAGDFAVDAEVSKNAAEAAAARAEAAAESVEDKNFVRTSGEQSIGGIKTFTDGIRVDKIQSSTQLQIIGDGVVVESYGGSDISFNTSGRVVVNGSNEVALKKDLLEIDKDVVHKEGFEEISGKKRFTNGIKLSQIEGEDGFSISAGDGSLILSSNADALDLRFGAHFLLNGDMTINGDVVATKKDLEDIGDVDADVVHKTGDEEIGGKKTFTELLDAPGIRTGEQLILSGDGVHIGGGSSSPIYLTSQGGVYVNNKEVATKNDITAAIQSAVLDSWEVYV